MINLKRSVRFVCLALIGPTSAEAGVFDLGADWSNASNPNGSWSYLLNGAPVGSSTRGNDPFSFPGPPPIWGDAHVGWSKSIGTESPLWDLQSGDVYGHPENGAFLSIAWTSPVAETVQASGGLWAIRDIGRSTDWLLLLNGAIIDEGNVFSGDSFSRSNPEVFSYYGAVEPGDVLELRVLPTVGQPFGDYVATTFAVTTVPEPFHAVLVSIALIGIAVNRSRNARSI